MSKSFCLCKVCSQTTYEPCVHFVGQTFIWGQHCQKLDLDKNNRLTTDTSQFYSVRYGTCMPIWDNGPFLLKYHVCSPREYMAKVYETVRLVSIWIHDSISVLCLKKEGKLCISPSRSSSPSHQQKPSMSIAPRALLCPSNFITTISRPKHHISIRPEDLKNTNCRTKFKSRASSNHHCETDSFCSSLWEIRPPVHNCSRVAQGFTSPMKRIWIVKDTRSTVTAHLDRVHVSWFITVTVVFGTSLRP